MTGASEEFYAHQKRQIEDKGDAYNAASVKNNLKNHIFLFFLSSECLRISARHHVLVNSEDNRV